MLSKRGVSFAAFNVEKTPEAWRDLQRFHVATVPAVIVGDRIVHGWNPMALEELFGWPHEEVERLAPAELVQRLGVILEIVWEALRQIPDEHLDIKTPDRERPLRRLAPHIFRVAQAYLDTSPSNPLTYEALVGEQAAPYARMGDILAYGNGIRANVRAWAAAPTSDGWDTMLETYYGPVRRDDLLERTVWHCAQHVRHVHYLMDQLGIEPRRPLRPEDVRGLPLPEALW